MAQGLLDDLLRGLRVAANGGPYSEASLAGVLEQSSATNCAASWTIALVGSLIVLWILDDRQTSRTRRGRGFSAVAGALLYRTVHPVQHALPGASAGPVQLNCRGAADGASRVDVVARSTVARLLAVILILFEAIPHIPIFCSPRASVRALGSLARGVEPEKPPPGCIIKWFTPQHCQYEWADYCQALDYLRRTTSPATEIANVLKEPPFPSFNGPVGRLSPVPSRIGNLLDVADRPGSRCPVCRVPGTNARLGGRLVAGGRSTPSRDSRWSG